MIYWFIVQVSFLWCIFLFFNQIRSFQWDGFCWRQIKESINNTWNKISSNARCMHTYIHASTPLSHVFIPVLFYNMHFDDSLNMHLNSLIAFFCMLILIFQVSVAFKVSIEWLWLSISDKTLKSISDNKTNELRRLNMKWLI